MKVLFHWTDKTGKGNNADKITIEYIQEYWDMEEESYSGVLLEDFLDGCSVGDEFETTDGKLTCTLMESKEPEKAIKTIKRLERPLSPEKESRLAKIKRYQARYSELFEEKFTWEDFASKVPAAKKYLKHCKEVAGKEVFQSNRGGKRDNAGRKRLYREETVVVAFRVPLSMAERVKKDIEKTLKEYQEGM